MNAAVWFGAAAFYVLGAGPALRSSGLRDLIGTNNLPYFSFAIQHLVAVSFFHLYLACSIVALLYLMAEWLYFGKYPPKSWLVFICCLVLLGGFRGFWVQPSLQSLHQAQHGRQTAAPERQVAARAFETWSSVARYLDLVLVASLAFYVWRTANPSDPMRFVSATKFRS
jgi:hypothetical protein